MQVNTGYGYFTLGGQIVRKYVLDPGYHVDPSDGSIPTEVANQTALDAINIYVAPVDVVDAFDVFLFQEQLLANFGADDNVLPYYSVIKDLATFKNFAGMSQLIDGLYQSGKVTLDEVNTLGTVLAGQSIVLSNF
jgi:hypothetical protein